MQRQLKQTLCLVWIAAAIGCSSPASSRLLHVGDEPKDSAGSSGAILDTIANPTVTPRAGASGAASTSEPKDDVQVGFRDASRQSLERVTLHCPGECVDIEAVADGGNPPYKFQWEDGSSATQRHICPAASGQLSVSATDTERNSGEFQHKAQTVMRTIEVQVLGCAATAGAPAMKPEIMMCHANTGAACQVAPGVMLPEDVTVDVPGATQRYYAGGATLPAGRYRLEYVDGCNTYGVGCDWTVHGATSSPGLMSCFLVANDQTVLSLTPGTAGVYVNDEPKGAFATYAECVAANCQLPPLDFDFPGGKLGVQRDGGGVLGAIDDAGGEQMGGRSPTFRLSRLDPCP